MLDADEKLAALRYALVDLTGIERSEVATDDLRVISEMVKGAKAKLSKRCMAIAATSDLAFGLARMYSAFVPGVGWEVGVFKDLAKAHSYIESNVGERFSFGVEHDSICETG